MVKACDTATIQDLVRHGTVQSVSQAGTSGQVTRVHPGGGAAGIPGGGTGWRDAAPLGPPPGINYVDRLIDAQDAKDRVELAQKLAKQKR
jgi:hypothetical protein